jgi:NAD(P)-dependent dehydrogenase (short-subunit alcohol dehydrogenase family)
VTDQPLAGRSALITGASRGLGLEIARHFVRTGADVFLCARHADALEDARRTVAAEAPARRVLAAAGDVSDEADVRRITTAAVAAFPSLDVLVSNAGVYGPMGPIESIDVGAWRRAIDINLIAPMLMARALVPHFKRRQRGKIIQISGAGATKPLANISAYAASKAAVVRLAETLAIELRPHGVDVNAVAPGALNTAMLDEVLAAGPNAVGREFYDHAVEQKTAGGTPPARGAELCVFLASPASDGITGKLIAAVWDPWRTLAAHRAELDATDIYTIRRILPEDRGTSFGPA